VDQAKYYARIDELSADEATTTGGQGSSEFDFSVLKDDSIRAKVASWLLHQPSTYALLRRFKPVLKFRGLYFVTRYDDVDYIRRNDELFEAPYKREMRSLTRGVNFLLGMGRGAEHERQLRFIMGDPGLDNGAFQRADLENIIIPHTQKVATQLLHYSGGEIDVIHDYLSRISVEVCAHYYGLEPDDPDAFAKWLMSLSALLFADYSGNVEVRRLAQAGLKRIEPVVDAAIQRARTCLHNKGHIEAKFGKAYCDWMADTVIGRLVAKQSSAGLGAGPTDDEIRAMIIGLAVGFVPTGAAAGGHILEVLQKKKKVWKRAVEFSTQDTDASSNVNLDAIISEAMRFKPPIIPGLPRYVVDKPDMSQKKVDSPRVDRIPKGATILAASMSAMFDPRALGRDIGRFKAGRTLRKPDLQFGGTEHLHYCIGERIFKEIIREALKPLLAQTNLRRARGQPGRMQRSGPFPQHLTVTFEPKAGHRHQSMITVCVPVRPGAKIDKINVLLDQLGNPAEGKFSDQLKESNIIHFAHMSVIEAHVDDPSTEDGSAHLLVEISSDGPVNKGIATFANCGCSVEAFKALFAEVIGSGERSDIADTLNAHYCELNIAPWQLKRRRATGLNFEGKPELSVDRIKQDQKIASAAREHVDKFIEQHATLGTLPAATIADVRRKLRLTEFGADLVRPSLQTLAVARRSNLELTETLRLFGKDWGVRLSVAGTVGFFALAYLLFLQGYAPSELTWSLVGAHVWALGNVFATFLVVTFLVVAAFFALGLLSRRQNPVVRFRMKKYLASQRMMIIALSVVLTLLQIILFQSDLVMLYGNLNPDGANIPPVPERFAIIGVIFWKLLVSLVLGALLAASFVTALAFYLRQVLKFSEDNSPPTDRDLDSVKYQEIMRRENNPEVVQNHIVLVTPLKSNPRWLRRITLFIGFYFIEKLVQYRFRPGFVLDLGTIHFARWFVIPKTNTMVFCSNYDGSGEAYFEDFVTKAQWGQTGVWSNGRGFPKTKDLVFKGAEDAARFKRWIRHNQQITRFWFTRYPDLTTDQIRTNALICEGLAKARTDSEIRAWMDLLGSRPRPKNALETSEIQSLVFGGMGKLKSSEMVAVEFPPKDAAGDDALAAWFKHLSGFDITGENKNLTLRFGERRIEDERYALNVALSPAGIRRLGLDQFHHTQDGLPSTAYDSLPAAFRSGMVSDDRKRLLGDSNHEHWAWGNTDNIHAVLLVYALNEDALEDVVQQQTIYLESKGFSIVHRLRTRQLGPGGGSETEPFGFRDNISQPVIMGSREFHDGANDIHVVQPGELILGYEDNAGYYPTTPVVNALAKGAGCLPSLPDTLPGRFPAFSSDPNYAPRDLGRNGTFLVIRQLEQDTENFKKQLENKAAKLNGSYGLDYITPEWLGAKIVGRWDDGSSLLRYPTKSKTKILEEKMLRPESRCMKLSNDLNTNRHSMASGPSGGADLTKTTDLNRDGSLNSAPVFSLDPRFEDNDFLYGADDPQGLKCPYSAHIRRANPRDSFSPGSADQVRISNRHRILRRGRVYEHTDKTGLLFMCLNANLERQFEFIQQTWLNSSFFHGLEGESDAIAGTNPTTKLSIPTSSGPLAVKGLESFVTVRGGGYFFLPSRSAIRFFGDLISPETAS
tara:strand:- start:7106 stop:12010 length:4905 start_codon:yes stop_codon:yes gene_type:complete